MSTSIVGYPQTFTPVFNPIWFYASSTNVNQPSFKYVCDVFSAGTNNRIFQQRLSPRYGDGLMECSMNQILSTQVSSYFNPTVFNFVAAPQNAIEYDVYVGEEYVYYWNFNSEYSAPGGGVAFSGSSNPFIAGDAVTISGTTTYDGNFYVAHADTNYFIISGLTYSTGNLTGTSVYVSNQTTTFSGLTSLIHNYAWNGSVPFKNFQSYNAANWYVNNPSTTANFLTNMPSGYTMNAAVNNNGFANFFAPNGLNTAKYLVVKTTNNGLPNGEYHYLNPISASTPYLISVPIAPNGINNFAVIPTIVAGSPPTPINSATTSYTVCLWNSSSAQTSANLFINVSQIIEQRFNNQGAFSECYEILFMDRLGAFLPANFSLVNRRTLDITRSEYQKVIGNLNGTSFYYNTWERGRTSINTTLVYQIVLNSNWVSEADGIYLEELYSSPLAYIRENGVYWAVVIVDKKFVYKTVVNDKLINYQLTVEYAVSDKVQNIFF